MKFVKTMIAGMIAFSSCNLSAKTPCKDFNNLAPSQHEVLQKSYSYGNKYDMGYTLAAISWVESTAGKNLQDNSSSGPRSYGPFMLLLGNVMKREGGKKYKNTSSTKVLRMASRGAKLSYIKRLKVDFNFSAKHAITELMYWKHRSSSEKELWASYNGGYNALTKPGAVRYSNKIKRTIGLFKTCKVL